MKMHVDYFDNDIIFTNDKIVSIEIGNKIYFYRFVKDLVNFESNVDNENILFFDNDKNINQKISVFIDFFNFDFNNKKTIGNINKYLCENILDEDKVSITKLYDKILKKYNYLLNDIDLPLNIDCNIDFETITKNMKITINSKDSLLDNLFLIIDIESFFKTNTILFFINLKNYLSDAEINEFYKYAIYNNVKIVMVDSHLHSNKKEFECKYTIDKDLDEFVI